MSDPSGATFTHYDSAGVEGIVQSVVVPMYVATHSDVSHDPFYGADRFVERVRGYTRAPGFEAVAADIAGNPVGLAFGYTLPVSARWWQGLTEPVDPSLIAETGRRTFAL